MAMAGLWTETLSLFHGKTKSPPQFPDVSCQEVLYTPRAAQVDGALRLGLGDILCLSKF